MTQPTPNLSLNIIAGPSGGSFTLTPERSTRVGRAAECEICLLNESVSRLHISVLSHTGTWYVVHESTRGVTFLNGLRLSDRTPRALASNDLLSVGPYTFRVTVGDVGLDEDTEVATTLDDATDPDRRIRAVVPGEHISRADRRLRLLTECLARLRAGGDEAESAGLVLDAALAGSGYSRGAILRPLAAGGEVQVVTSRRSRPEDQTPLFFSRSLLARAAAGEAVIMTSQSVEHSPSLGAMGVHSALCAPVPLGASIAAYLYLDARGQESGVQADAAGFCEAAARACGFAWAEARRVDLERRQTQLSAELSAAHTVQRTMMPPTEGDFGFLRYAIMMRPGLFVAGDLFDCFRLPDNRVAVAIGDATGRGAASALLMVMTQSYLHAELMRTGDPGEALRAVNRYVATRVSEGHFVTVWVGMFGPDGTLTYVDAGHGHAMLRAADGSCRTLSSASGIPIGVQDDYPYRDESIRLAPGERLLLYSDGLIEQNNSAGVEFGSERIVKAVANTNSPTADVEAVASSLRAFAGDRVDDDATIASVAPAL